MDELIDHLRRELGVPNAQVHQGVRTRAGVVDLLLAGPDATYVIEVKARAPPRDALAQLSLYISHPSLLEEAAANAHLQGVLVAPAFPRAIQELAQEIGIRLIEAPLDILPEGIGPRALLTKPKAWSVVIAVLQERGTPSIRHLAGRAGASTGWTSNILRTLQSKGLLDEDGQPSKDILPRLFDHVATERPLKRLERTRISTGIDDWAEFQLTIQTQWSHIMGRMTKSGMWVCGQSAAMGYTDYIMRHDRLQVYAHDAQAIKRVFEGRKGGIEIVVYEPDRNVGPDSTMRDGWLTVSHEQALLDVAGMGYSARDTATKLAEALRA